MNISFGEKQNLEKLKKIPNHIELTVDFLPSFKIDSFDNLYSILSQKYLIKVKIYSKLTLEMFQLFKIQTIRSLYLNLESFNLKNNKELKESLSQMTNLKSLTLMRGESKFSWKDIQFRLSDVLPEKLNHLENIHLFKMKIDDDFNQIFSDTKLKKITFAYCKFVIDFEFKVDLKNLRKISYVYNENISMNNLYESIKDNNERLSLYFHTNNDTNKEKLENLLKIIMNLKFSVLELDDSVYKSILNTKLKIDVENLILEFSINSTFIFQKYISKVSNLKSISFNENTVDKEILDFLKEQKELKILKIGNFIYFTSEELFDILNSSKIEKLILHDEDFETPKEFFNLLKENKSIKELDIYFWDNAIYDMIISNTTLEILKITTESIEGLNNNDIKILFESLKKNSSINELYINPCDNLISLKDYLCSNPKITTLEIETDNEDYSLFQSLIFNTNLKKLIIHYHKSIEIEIDKIKKEIEYLFQFNYSLIYFEINHIDLNPFDLDIFDEYQNRNKEISRIYSRFIIGEDLYFKFN